jgi:arsenate reductase
MKRVLVLCTGNSSRSQIAEGYLKFYGNGNFEVHSAGLQDHGVNPLAVEAMKTDNIDISDQFSKPLEYFYGEHFNYLISVCEVSDNAVLKDITYDEFFHCEVEDPAIAEGTHDQKIRVFNNVREQLKRCILKFIGKTRQRQAS